MQEIYTSFLLQHFAMNEGKFEWSSGVEKTCNASCQKHSNHSQEYFAANLPQVAFKNVAAASGWNSDAQPEVVCGILLCIAIPF